MPLAILFYLALAKHFDSLKLREMFIQKGNNSWDQTAIEAHQKRMLDVLETHYGDKE